MDRFFSKLDLRDIKIKPEGTRFLPTEDDTETVSAPESKPNGYFNSPSALASSPLHRPAYQPADIEPESAPETTPLSGVAPEAPQGGCVEAVHYENGEVLKVSAKSRPSAVAGAIAGVVRDVGRAEVQAIGAGATNQAVKAVAIARDYLLESGIDAICIPAFIDVTIDSEERTAMRLVVETR